MEINDSIFGNEKADNTAGVRRIGRAQRAKIVNALISVFSESEVDFSHEGLRRATLAMGLTLSVRQLQFVRSDLLLYFDNKGQRPVTQHEIKSWSDSVKLRVAAHIAPCFASGAIYPSYAAVSSELAKSGFMLDGKRIKAVKEKVEALLGKADGTLDSRVETFSERMSDQQRLKLLQDLRAHFKDHPGHISLADVKKKIVEWGLSLKRQQIIELRYVLLKSDGRGIHKQYMNLQLRDEYDALAKRLAQHFIQHGNFRPTRIDIEKAGKAMGVDIPYWRTELLMTLVLDVAPSLTRGRYRPKKVKTVGTPVIHHDTSKKSYIRLQVSSELLDFVSAFGESIGKTSSRRSSYVTEYLTLVLAYGFYSGTIDLGSLILGARRMSKTEIETATKMLRRFNFGDL